MNHSHGGSSTSLQQQRQHCRLSTDASSSGSTSNNDMIPNGKDDNDDDGQLTSNLELLQVLQQFPQDELVYAFGYGSGVFSQQLMIGSTTHHHVEESSAATATSDRTSPPPTPGMLDLILVVRNAQKFHEANLQIHPHHYASWLKYFGGASIASWIQRQFPLADAKVLFHVVDGDDEDQQLAPETVKKLPPMKYGVVQFEDLQNDLTQWNHLYLAGRLHKPTLPILVPPPDEFVEAQHINLQAAVSAALLLLSTTSTNPTAAAPPSVSPTIADNTAKDNKEEQEENDETNVIPWSTLYGRIASLSYTGDFRMQVGGEDPEKISKLVHGPGQIQRFQDLYQNNKECPVLQPLEQLGLLTVQSNGVVWDPSNVASRQVLWGNLPPTLQQLQPNYGDGSRSGAGTVKHHDQSLQLLAQGLAAIVAPAARYQSFKGLFTLGARKSFKYAKAKLSKGLFRNTNK